MSDLESLESLLAYHFQRTELLSLALTHRSFPLEPGEEHNEKLEFLGDAVLGLAMSYLLMQRFLEANEGDLSKQRASLVYTQARSTKAAILHMGCLLSPGTAP